MRRPLCVFCIGTLGLELVCAFLPQMGLFVPFAAFFAAGLLFAAAGRLCRKPAWGYGICLVLGAALGLCLTANTRARLERLTTAYDGRTLLLEAEVEQVSSSWSADAVRAVLRVEQAAGEPVSFRVECARLPVCEAGDRLRGRFALEAPAVSGQQDLCADGVVLTAEAVEDPVPLGGSRSFRARTARLQKRLSAALRQGMAAGPAGVLAALLDRWALWVSGWPGAQLWFDTGYAAAVCLLLAGLCWLAFHSRVRLRVALPALLVTAAVAISTGNALSRDVVHLELVGSRNAPAAVLSRNDRAVILFRGGETTENAVKTVLERRNIRTVECLVDLRTAPEYLRRMGAENFLAADRMQPCTTRRARCSMAEVEVLRTQSGCIVRVQAAGQTFVTLSGSVKLARPVRADWLLASASRPDAVQYRNVLTLSTRYRWMDAENTETEWETVDALSYRVPKAGDSE